MTTPHLNDWDKSHLSVAPKISDYMMQPTKRSVEQDDRVEGNKRAKVDHEDIKQQQQKQHKQEESTTSSDVKADDSMVQSKLQPPAVQNDAKIALEEAVDATVSAAAKSIDEDKDQKADPKQQDKVTPSDNKPTPSSSSGIPANAEESDNTAHAVEQQEGTAETASASATITTTAEKEGETHKAKSTKESSNEPEGQQPEQEEEQQKSSGTTALKGLHPSIAAGLDNKALMTFPERLMSLLDGGDVTDAMWWLPEGDSFCLMPQIFSKKVLDKYFQGTKFESFTRKLNRWGFKRVAGQKVPSNAVAYHHHFFQRGKNDLLKNMAGGKKKDNEMQEMLLQDQLARDLGSLANSTRPEDLFARQQQHNVGFGLQSQLLGLQPSPGLLHTNRINQPAQQQQFLQLQQQSNQFNNELMLQMLLSSQFSSDTALQQTGLQQQQQQQQALTAASVAGPAAFRGPMLQQEQARTAAAAPSSASELRMRLLQGTGFGLQQTGAPGGGTDLAASLFAGTDQRSILQQQQQQTQQQQPSIQLGQVDSRLLQFLLQQQQQQQQQQQPRPDSDRG